ncbi:hypothetical protein [Schumannella soli]|uniref:Gluconate 2-dehydrogenase subunit 3 family protein n=1 Tax=Schumannella soli TaxID=2590779 RepID=A0A506XQ25_9MICO|nr:hypothetical protein [Schumannella soli]TPW74824.1 hypothetical protein FJ657_14735 [Schumannella soli]
MSYQLPASELPPLSDAERELLGRVADVLIPAGTGVDGVDMPTGSAGHVASTGIDRVLSVRPDLLAPVRTALGDLAAREDDGRALPAEFASLAATPPAEFPALADAITAAYFLDADVARRVGYEKRSVIPIVFDDDLDDVTSAVRARGAIYRATPDTAPLPIGTPPSDDSAGTHGTGTDSTEVSA